MFSEKMNRNSYIAIIVALAIIALLVLIPYSNLPDSGEPMIQVTPKLYDFGVIQPIKVETEFTIKNAGEGELEIISVSTSCGCTKAKASKETIGPGETAKLFVEMDPNVMGNITGKVERTIYVQSNDPEHSEVEVKITAEITP